MLPSVLMIGAVSVWDRKCNTYSTCQCKSPVDCTDTSQWSFHSCSSGTRAVEKLTWYRIRIGTIPTESPRSTVRQSIASIPLLVECTSVSRRLSSTDAILQISLISTRCRWDNAFLCSILWTDEACFVHEGMLNVTSGRAWDNPHAIRKHGYRACLSVSIWAGIVGAISYPTGWLLSTVIFRKLFCWGC
jgi:hypothetical protein